MTVTWVYVVLTLSLIATGATASDTATFCTSVESVASPSSWSGVALSECGQLGTLLGGYSMFGMNMNMSTVAVDLPSHDSVQVDLVLIALDTWGPSDSYIVDIDGNHFGPFDQITGAEVLGNVCGLQALAHVPTAVVDTRRQFSVILPHSSPSITVRVSSRLGKSPAITSLGLESAAIRLLNAGLVSSSRALYDAKPTGRLSSSRVSVLSAPRSLLSSCSTPLRFLVDSDNFTDGVDGWTGAPTTVCGTYGSMLGGFPVFGFGNLSKTLVGMPPHSALQLSVDVFALDDWQPTDYFNILIDDAVFGPYHKNDGSMQLGQACGLPVDAVGAPPTAGADTRRSLCLSVPHTSPSVSIIIESLVQQDLEPGLCCSWLGIENVEVRVDATPSPSPSVTVTASATGSVTLSSTPSGSASESITASFSSTSTLSRSDTVTFSPSASSSTTDSSSQSGTVSAQPSASLSSSVTLSPSSSDTATSSGTSTSSVSFSGSTTDSTSPTFSVTESATVSPTDTSSSSATPTASASLTDTSSASSTISATASLSTSITASDSTSPSASSSTSPSASASMTVTLSGSTSLTPSPSESSSPTLTLSTSAAVSLSMTGAPSPSSQSSVSRSSTASTTGSVSPSGSTSPSVTTSVVIGGIVNPSSNVTLLACSVKSHPWEHDTIYKGYGIGIATFISALIGTLWLLLYGRLACVTAHSLRRSLDSLSRVFSPADRTSYSGSFFLFLWTSIDWFCRTAPFSWSVVQWSVSGPRINGIVNVFHLFLLRPRHWWLLGLFIVLICVALTFYYILDRRVIKYSDPDTGLSVLPKDMIASPLKSADAGVSRSVLAWALLGVGRAMSGPLLLPAAYILLDPWLCVMQAGSTVLGGGPSQSELQYFVTADCSSVLRCYGFWHWVYLVVTAAGICGLMWGYGRYQIPISLKGSFGLPHFEAATVPIRLILAWSARVLIYFSPCWSLWVSAVCNIALLLLLVLFLRSYRLTLHLYTAAFLLFVYTFCAGVGLAAVAVYYSTHSPSRHSSCSVAIAWGVLTTIALIAVAVYLCTCRRPSGEGPEEEPREKQDTILVRDPPLMDKAAPSRFVPGRPAPASATDVVFLDDELRHAEAVVSRIEDRLAGERRTRDPSPFPPNYRQSGDRAQLGGARAGWA